MIARLLGCEPTGLVFTVAIRRSFDAGRNRRKHEPISHRIGKTLVIATKPVSLLQAFEQFFGFFIAACIDEHQNFFGEFQQFGFFFSGPGSRFTNDFS